MWYARTRPAVAVPAAAHSSPIKWKTFLGFSCTPESADVNTNRQTRRAVQVFSVFTLSRLFSPRNIVPKP